MKTSPLRIAEAAQAVMKSYAIVFFSGNTLVGTLLFIATFFVPRLGLTGAGGTLVAFLCGKFIGLDRKALLDGRLLFNSMLCSLAVAYWLPPSMVSPAYYVMVVIVVSLCALLATVLLNHYSVILNNLPSMSLPFCAVAILLHWFLAEQRLLFPSAGISTPSTLPALWNHSMGVLFFSVDSSGAILVTLALLLASRLSFLHGLIGFAVSLALIGGTGHAYQNYAWLHANCTLTAIAVGGVFFISSRATLLLAAIGAALCAFTGIALLHAFGFLGVPVLTIPFNIATFALLIALRWRTASKGIENANLSSASPEAGVRDAHLFRSRLMEASLPSIAPPFDGQWVVTQGFDGEHTHRGAWACALDFEIADAAHRPCRPSSSLLTDFPSFDAPIIAPADGKILRVVHDIPDNPIGENNLLENWGNSILLEIAPQLYVQLSHLRQHGIKVREGEYVRRGQLLGYLGNSGRSPVPHLHLQMQTFPEIGAAPIPFRLHGYRVLNQNRQWVYPFRGLPQEGESISGCRLAPWLDATKIPYNEGEKIYRVLTNGAEHHERIERRVEADGLLSWHSPDYKTTLVASIQGSTLVPLEYSGTKKSLLSLLWLAGRIPLCAMEGMGWEETADPSCLMKPRLSGVLSGFLESFYTPSLPRLRGAIAHCDPKSKLYSVEGTIFPSQKNAEPFMLTLEFGDGLDLLSARLEGKPGEIHCKGLAVKTSPSSPPFTGSSQSIREARKDHGSQNPASHLQALPRPALQSRCF